MFLSLTLTPALAALLLKPHETDKKAEWAPLAALHRAEAVFNRGFDRLSERLRPADIA